MPARLLPELHCALRLLSVGQELPVVPRPGIERVRGGLARPGRRAAAGYGVSKHSISECFPSEHAARQAEVAKEASDVHQVLLHTVHSNPWNLRPRKGSYFRLWLRSTDETLLTQRAY